MRGERINACCQLPGNPITGSLVLIPNPVEMPPVRVAYGPIELPERLDTCTLFVRSPGTSRHEHTLAFESRALDSGGRVLAESTTPLTSGSDVTVTLPFTPPEDRKAAFAFGLAFDHYAGGTTFGSIGLYYMLVYQRNPLVELCNAAGTDKGTEPHVGRGAPHCYAIDYHELFAPFREEEIRLLEIGLETASTESGETTDAPSLRVWREYFPRARIYGYDIHDFTHFEQPGTVTFQGDQSSRADLERFVGEHGDEPFRFVIDDGSHASSHQQVTLAALFPHVEPGGLYVVEDLQWQPFPEAPKTLEVLQRYIDGGGIHSPFIPDDEAHYLEQTIESVEIRKPNDAEIGVIRKKPA